MRRTAFALTILAALSGSAPAQQPQVPRFGLSDLTQDDLLKIGRGIDAIVREEGAKGISQASAVYLKEALDLHLKLQAQITRQGAVLAEQAQKAAIDKAVTEAVNTAVAAIKAGTGNQQPEGDR